MCDVACMCAVCVYIKQVSIASDAILTVILMKIGNQVSYEPNVVMKTLLMMHSADVCDDPY